MPIPFSAKLAAAVHLHDSLLCVGLDPDPAQAPAAFQRSDPAATILAWNLAVIEATADLACAFKPNIAFYEALGEPGLQALRATLAAIPPDVPVILDAKRGDIGSTAAAYARAVFDGWGVDAVTLSPYLGRDSVAPFAAHAGKGLFVLCHTSNPSAGDFQQLEISDWRTLDREPNQPLYVHVARAATAWSQEVGLVVGATYPDALAAVRRAAPKAWFLVPGVGAQGGDLAATVAAGLRPDGLGLIINASRGVCAAPDPRAAALALRDAINEARARTVSSVQSPVSSVQSPVSSEQFPVSSVQLPVTSVQSPVSTVQPPVPNNQYPITNHQSLITALADLGALKFGRFTLASGKQSPIYVDLRLLVSAPRLLAQAARAYAGALAGVGFDRLCGVPYAALPIATAVALETDKPLIYPRKEAKAHGLGREIEGAWQAGERVVVVEDLITSGGSTLQTVERLRAAGLVVEHAVVLIDREQGGVENLAAAGVTAHSVFTLSAMLDTLVAAGKLDAAKRDEVIAFLKA